MPQNRLFVIDFLSQNDINTQLFQTFNRDWRVKLTYSYAFKTFLYIIILIHMLKIKLVC